jgi:hypothetical protein
VATSWCDRASPCAGAGENQVTPNLAVNRTHRLMLQVAVWAWHHHRESGRGHLGVRCAPTICCAARWP